MPTMTFDPIIIRDNDGNETGSLPHEQADDDELNARSDALSQMIATDGGEPHMHAELELIADILNGRS